MGKSCYAETAAEKGRGPSASSSSSDKSGNSAEWGDEGREGDQAEEAVDSVTETPGRQCRRKTNSGVASGETPSRDERNWVAMTLANEYR